MTFLPIVERELRIAARRRNTYRIRWWTAVLAMLGSLVASCHPFGGRTGQPWQRALHASSAAMPLSCAC